jgi:ABC-type phosphate transport system permease subunit
MQPPPSVIVEIVPTPTRETTLADIILGSLGLTGVLVLIAFALGAVVALLLVRWRRRHPPELDRLPPVSPPR